MSYAEGAFGLVEPCYITTPRINPRVLAMQIFRKVSQADSNFQASVGCATGAWGRTFDSSGFFARPLILVTLPWQNNESQLITSCFLIDFVSHKSGSSRDVGCPQPPAWGRLQLQRDRLTPLRRFTFQWQVSTILLKRTIHTDQNKGENTRGL